MNLSKVQKIFLGIIIFLFLANLVLLNIKVFLKKEEATTPLPTPGAEKPFSLQQPTSQPTGQTCPAACLDEIYQATAEATKISPLPQKKTEVSQPTIKEFYIPLGSGSTKSRDWEEMAGVEAVIDRANFPNVDSIILEATMRIPTANGRVYAKLYDVTAKHDIWFSEVWVEGSTSYRAESANISLSEGRHLYRLMMKSTMGYEAILDSARLKIILK